MTETIYLSQKHPIKGSREFELHEDEVQYSVQSPIRSESLSVVLSVLSPEPIVSGSTLSFISEVNKEPLVELFLNKPDKESFDQFVLAMKSRIIREDFSRFPTQDTMVRVDMDRLDETLVMLKSYVAESEIETLLTTLSDLKESPDSLDCVNAVASAFNELGFVKGQVVNYAPYIAYLLSGNQTHDELLDD
ncbi:MAG: hypothetical protein AAF353_00635 [Pseudomonadota bacterium]